MPANVRIDLPNFIRDVYHLPNRILDLLELAAYVYCADRKVSRGAKHLVEYHSWARSFHFAIKVRDYEFWKRPEVANSLASALTFHGPETESTDLHLNLDTPPLERAYSTPSSSS